MNILKAIVRLSVISKYTCMCVWGCVYAFPPQLTHMGKRETVHVHNAYYIVCITL